MNTYSHEPSTEPDAVLTAQGHGRSWLFSLLLRRPQWLTHLSTFYRQLRSLPRRQRRWMARRANTAPNLRILAVDITGNLTLNSTTIFGGSISDYECQRL